MKSRNWLLGTAVLSLALSAPMLAQAKDAVKTDRVAQAETEKKEKDKTPKLNKRTQDMLEAIFNTTLTPEQQQAIAAAAAEQSAAKKAADQAFRQKVATSLGITLEDYDVKEKTYRDKQKATAAEKKKTKEDAAD